MRTRHWHQNREREIASLQYTINAYNVLRCEFSCSRCGAFKAYKTPTNAYTGGGWRMVNERVLCRRCVVDVTGTIPERFYKWKMRNEKMRNETETKSES